MSSKLLLSCAVYDNFRKKHFKLNHTEFPDFYHRVDLFFLLACCQFPGDRRDTLGVQFIYNYHANIFRIQYLDSAVDCIIWIMWDKISAALQGKKNSTGIDINKYCGGQVLN